MVTDFDYGGYFGLPEKQMIGNATNANIPVPQCLKFLFIMDIHIVCGHRISLENWKQYGFIIALFH